MVKIKEPVRLRRRKTRTGLQSLYLDIYYEGQRTYEYLHMYLVPEVTREDKYKNQETLRMAEAVRAKRMTELRNNIYGFRSTSARTVPFFDYYDMCAGDHPSAADSWKACKVYLQRYEKNGSLVMSQATKAWLEGFHDFLNETTRIRCNDGDAAPLAEATKHVYWAIIRTMFRKAAKDGIVTIDPTVDIKNFKMPESTRMYLTVDEVRRLTQAECPKESLKTAFLFSCLTGLRKSDIKRLTWADVQQQDSFTRIIFRQKKTKHQEYLDITPQAAELMGERGKDDALVFGDNFDTGTRTSEHLAAWMAAAGISKKITFHCARHTFAVMMLDLGTDIYTVSKLLGHREVSTTQIYAKVLDKNKQAAVMNIPKIL